MDIAFLTIAELNRLYDRRELSPVEVTQALLDRIAAHDGGRPAGPDLADRRRR